MKLANLSRKALVCTPVFFIAFSLSCMFPLKTDEPLEQFHFAAAGNPADTISPYGPIFLKFSRPVKSVDSVRFIFSHGFTEYQVLWSSSNDTAKLVLVLPLDGNAAYIVSPAGNIESTDGSKLIPGKDSIKLITFRCEKEPNGSRDLADLLQGTVFGQITMANDTDCFLVSDAVQRSFYLKSTGSTSTFVILDDSGRSISPDTYAPAETLSVPVAFVPPFLIRIHAYNHSNGGTYELGWTKR